MRPAGRLHSSGIPANLCTTVSWGYSWITFSPKPSRLPLSKTSSVTVWQGKSLRCTFCKVELCCTRRWHKLQFLMSILMFGTCSNGHWQWFVPVKSLKWQTYFSELWREVKQSQDQQGLFIVEIFVRWVSRAEVSNSNYLMFSHLGQLNGYNKYKCFMTLHFNYIQLVRHGYIFPSYLAWCSCLVE